MTSSEARLRKPQRDFRQASIIAFFGRYWTDYSASFFNWLSCGY